MVANSLSMLYVPALHCMNGIKMAKKRKKRAYKAWTKDDLSALRKHSRAKTAVSKISKLLKRTEATIRMKAYSLGLPVGHRRRKA